MRRRSFWRNMVEVGGGGVGTVQISGMGGGYQVK